jgi:hypothetical protein
MEVILAILLLCLLVLLVTVLGAGYYVYRLLKQCQLSQQSAGSPYSPNSPQQSGPNPLSQGNMSPWIAGGLGALGGGLAGYGLGQIMGEHEQTPADSSLATMETAPADAQGQYADIGSAEGADFGWGEDVDGGDFGGQW